MVNPFGLPDEVMNAIIMSALRQGAQESKKGGAGQNFGPSPQMTPTSEAGAKAAKKIYDAFVLAGFSQDQAFELLKLVMAYK